MTSLAIEAVRQSSHVTCYVYVVVAAVAAAVFIISMVTVEQNRARVPDALGL